MTVAPPEEKPPILQRQLKLVEHFNSLGNWEARYKEIIAMGKRIPEMPKELYQDQFLVKGCQSQVWLKASRSVEGKVILQADSDALIVKGLVTLLLETFSQSSPQEILQSSPEFIKDLGFAHSLSPSRANGFLAMLKQIHLYATAFNLVDKGSKS